VPGEHVGHPVAPGRHESRGPHPVRGGHAAEHERLLHVVAVPQPGGDPAGTLRRVGHGVPGALLVEAVQHGGGRGRPELRRVGMRGVAALRGQHGRAAEGEHHPRTDVVAGHHRADQVGSTAAELLGDRQRGRHDPAARMGQRRRVRVVGLVGVRGHPVGQRGIHGPGPQRRTDHCGPPGRVLGGRVGRAAHPGRQARAGHHGGHRVEDVRAGLRDHRLGKLGRARGGQIPGQSSGVLADGHVLLPTGSRVAFFALRDWRTR
jgi:hypothetical protein